MIKGQLLELEKLAKHAMNDAKEEFPNSPEQANEIIGTVMDALAVDTAMSKKAILWGKHGTT